MASGLEKFMKVIFPKRISPSGNSQTNSYSPDAKDTLLATPGYKDHMTDIFQSRQADNAQTLLKSLFVHDPDVSAAVNAFLTVADTEPVFTVLDPEGNHDREGAKALNQIISSITTRYDYSKGFMWKPSIRALSENMRYMLLLRGGIGEELVFDKNQAPVEIRHVDLSTIKWFEKSTNQFTPIQETGSSGKKISLDVPTFFVSFFRRDPTSIYSNSPFVSAINTVAARQQVINDLYRIMQETGFPRIEATVLEEVLLKNAPAAIKQNADKQQKYVEKELASIQSKLTNTPVNQAMVHTDSVKINMFNDAKPANTMNIDSIVGALNALNQAALRTMATILGRGQSGVNTASVEARVFSMNAEALNEPVAELWSQLLTMALRVVAQSESTVTCKFRPVELRPQTELEPQLTMRAARLKADLSLGIISDDQYHLEMYGRIRPDTSPELSGTNFMDQTPLTVQVDKVTPNGDPLGRSMSPKGSKAAKGSNIKK